MLVAVTSRGTVLDDVCVRGGLRPVPGHEHFIDECVIKCEDGYISIANLSENQIEVSDKQILVRCVVSLEEIFLKESLNV